MKKGICPTCTQQNQLDANFCEACGGPMKSSSPSKPDGITIGRDPACDLVLDYWPISSRHAILRETPNGLEVEDLDSTNGLFLNSVQNRIDKSPVDENDTLYLGSFALPVKRILRVKSVWLPSQRPHIPYPAQNWFVGSDPTAAIQANYLAPKQAEFSIKDSKLLVRNCIPNGVEVNGRSIKEWTSLDSGDQVSIGALCLIPDKTGLYKIEAWKNLSLEAKRVSILVDSGGEPKNLLQDISFTLFPGQLCGILGVAGSGKTTLIKTLNGYQTPSSGVVLVNGADLYEQFESFKSVIGYVPQEDIFHKELTVEQALGYAVKLRLSSMPRKEKDAKIDTVLGRLGMFEANPQIRKTRISKISGGQRRCLNIAIELLTDPAIFFLDEPTSGLSSEDALLVMNLLHKMAEEGKTILLTLHQPAQKIYQLMDQVLYLQKGGVLVYTGPAVPDSILYTNPEIPPAEATNPSLVLRALDKGQPQILKKTFERSPYHQEYIRNRRKLNLETPVPFSNKRKGVVSSLSQWMILHSRNFRARFQDHINASVLILQAPIIAILIGLVFQSDNRAIYKSASTIYFLMVIASVWFGCSNSAREICGEWPIYCRERKQNLGIKPYLMSKLSVGVFLNFSQCLVLLAIVFMFCKLNAPFSTILLYLVVSSISGTCVGLFVSAFASPFKKRNEIALGLIPIVLLPMVILGGMIKPLKDMSPGAATLAAAMPTRWAYEAALVVEDSRTFGEITVETALGSERVRKRDILLEPLFAREKLHTAGFNFTMLLMIGAIFILLTYFYLKHLDRRGEL